MPQGVLTSLSPGISQLNALDVLILSQNSLVELPEEIGAITSLRVLEVDRNALERVPQSIGALEKLEVLNLASNQIESLEPLLEGSLPNLLTLLLDNNQISELVLPFSTVTVVNHA